MIRIGMCPDPFFKTKWSTTANPNLHWQAEAIQQAGGEIIGLQRNQVQDPTQWQKLGLDVVHLHWPGAVFNVRVRRIPVQKVLPEILVRTWTKYRLQQWAARVRQSSTPVVWQIHDILSHHADGYNYAADVMLHKMFFALSDGIFLHGENCLDPITKFYGTVKRYAIAPLGSYRRLYGEPIPQADARAQLGLTNSGKVFAYLGTARPQRNPGLATETFLKHATSHDVMIVAGNNVHLYLPPNMDERIKVFPGVIPTALFHQLLCASDFVINDGKNYLTSAIIRAAMSYAKPVIAYPFGSAWNMAKDAALWIPDTETGLAQVIQSASGMDKLLWQKLSDAAARNENQITWQSCGEACMQLYREVVENRKAGMNREPENTPR